MEGKKDASQIKPLTERFEKKFTDKKIVSATGGLIKVFGAKKIL